METTHRPLTFVTGNQKKLEEVRAIFGDTFRIPINSRSIERKYLKLWFKFCVLLQYFYFSLNAHSNQSP